MVQMVTWFISLFFMVLIAVVFEGVSLNSTEKEDQKPIVKRWYKALQFGWNISQTEFDVGDSAEFRVTTAAVTQGFGIYNGDMLMLAQSQEIPGSSKVYITFDEPGSYKVLCLKYCGLGDHFIMATLVVK